MAIRASRGERVRAVATSPVREAGGIPTPFLVILWPLLPRKPPSLSMRKPALFCRNTNRSRSVRLAV